MTTETRPADRLEPTGAGETLNAGDGTNDSTGPADDGADASSLGPSLFAAAVARDNARRAADDLAVTVRNKGDAELLDWRGRLMVDALEPGYADDDTNALARFVATERLAAVDAELARRERAAARASGVAPPSDARHVAWADVARELRDAVPVPMALERLGHPMRRVGRDRDGRDEYHGPCPFCGGKDRFIAWGPPRSRYLCRQCSGDHADDVVTLWRNATGLGFVDACEELLDIAGVPR